MFENLKIKLQKKIEEDTVKSELKGEVVILKKSKMPLVGDWTRIYPPVNEDGSWNIPNLLFGGKKNLIRMLILLAVIAMVVWQFAENYSVLGQAVECCNKCNGLNLFG